MRAFQEALIHDLKEDDFADMYAQTIAYGLLTARVSRQSGALVAEDIPAMFPKTSPFLAELLETFLHLGGRQKKGRGAGFDAVKEMRRSQHFHERDPHAVLVACPVLGRHFKNRSQLICLERFDRPTEGAAGKGA